jgi:hypothetical protein
MRLTLFLFCVISYIMKMELTCSSETSVYNKSTRRHIPEDGIHHVTASPQHTQNYIAPPPPGAQAVAVFFRIAFQQKFEVTENNKWGPLSKWDPSNACQKTRSLLANFNVFSCPRAALQIGQPKLQESFPLALRANCTTRPVPRDAQLAAFLLA